MTRPPKELANNVGNASLPRTGASIANSVLRTAHGTGCCKVSTPDQKLDAQLDAVWAAGGEKVFQDVMSSTRQDRPGLTAALSHLRAGDTLVVTQLDRLGRSVKGLLTLTEQLQAEDIGCQSLSDAIDTPPPMGRFFCTVMAACAELERNLIVERTKTGLAAARARGRVGGRPRRMTARKVQMMCATLRTSQMTVSALAKELGIHRATVYEYVQPDGTPTALGYQVLGTRAADMDMAADSPCTARRGRGG